MKDVSSRHTGICVLTTPLTQSNKSTTTDLWSSASLSDNDSTKLTLSTSVAGAQRRDAMLVWCGWSAHGYDTSVTGETDTTHAQYMCTLQTLTISHTHDRFSEFSSHLQQQPERLSVALASNEWIHLRHNTMFQINDHNSVTLNTYSNAKTDMFYSFSESQVFPDLSFWCSSFFPNLSKNITIITNYINRYKT